MIFDVQALGDLCEVTIGRQRSPQHATGEHFIPYIRAANVKDGCLALESVLEMNFSPAEQVTYGLQPGDVLVTEGCGSPAELGASAMWRGEIPGSVGFQNHVLRLRARSGVSDSMFLYQLARWCHHSGRWQRVASGTSILNIGLARAKRIEVPAPSVREQERIGAVLGAFEDLILNDQARIAALEQASRLLYRERFAEGGMEEPPSRDPSHERLGSVANWFSGGTPSTSVPEYWGGDIPWITSGSLKSFVLRDSDRRLTPEGVAAGSRVVERDTLLFVVRGMSLAKEFRRGIADRPMAFGQDCKALVAKPGLDPLFLAFAVDALAPRILGMVEYAAHGTGKLSTDRLQALEIPVPALAVQQQFVENVRPMRELISVLSGEADRLRAARDRLLPKLVTGTIGVDSLGVDDAFGWTDLVEAGPGT